MLRTPGLGVQASIAYRTRSTPLLRASDYGERSSPRAGKRASEREIQGGREAAGPENLYRGRREGDRAGEVILCIKIL